MVHYSDDEVEVGADLYEIDTEAEATVEGTAAAEPAAASTETVAAAPEPAAAAPVPTPATTSSGPQPRVPSIQFLGKNGWAAALTPEPQYIIPATYGRLEFSEDEMEALLSGGANLAPEVQTYSTGASFSA